MAKESLGVSVLIVLLFIGVLLLVAFPLKALINYTFSPELLKLLFGGPITYWHTVALDVVCTALFKGTGVS